MAGELQPLISGAKIVNEDGTPTDYFMRWAQNRQIDINDSITLGQLIQVLASIQINAGVGLGGGGALAPDSSVTIDLENTGVSPGNYVNAGFTVDAQGRLTAASSGVISGARVVCTATFTPAAGLNSVSWQSEQFDNGGFFDLSQPTRLTIPAGISHVQLSGGMRTNGGAAVNQNVSIWRNGSIPTAGNNADSGFPNQWMAVSSGPLAVVAGDYFEFRYEYSSITSKVVQLEGTFFSIQVLR